MKLSIIIVNYNVRYFLELALQSVRRAAEGMQAEVFVVDNASSDDSEAMVSRLFPEVRWIGNRENVGFSKANNQAIALARGEYVLLLNPDTVVAEDTFSKLIAFMDATPDAGGVGVRMIDGTGTFLPESKRGFPSPSAAFYKIFGLSKFFPRSRRFNRYHLGYLPERQTHEIEILSGAFMAMRAQALERVGLLDETFFMYGEDIDLSYRLLKGGYKNYYLADTTIVHYKGESTKKGSLNYVKTFYQAMIIFARKHFGGRGGAWFVALLQFAIYFRAALTLLSNWARRAALPLLEGGGIYLGLCAVKEAWARWHFEDPHYYDHYTYLYSLNFPIYTGIWLLAIYLRGGYDRQPKPGLGQLLTGLALGSLVISAVYGFLPPELRASRMLILLGTLSGGLAVLGLRALSNLFLEGKAGLAWSSAGTGNRIAIVGSATESLRVLELLYRTNHSPDFVGTVLPQAPPPGSPADRHCIGHLEQLQDLTEWYEVEEWIFCAADLPFARIVEVMDRLGPGYRYKIVAPGSEHVVGSNSKNGSGDSYTLDLSLRLAQPYHRRNKRLFDLAICCLILCLLPLFLIVQKRPWTMLAHWASVLWGKRTWVGYAQPAASELPRLPQAVLPLHRAFAQPPSDKATLDRLNLFYAKDYSVFADWKRWLKGIREL